MAQICRTMVAFAARASALQAWNTWIVPDTIRQSTRIHRVRAPACGRRTYLHRNRAWGIVKWPHVITATDARGEAASPARRNSRRRSGSVPGRPRRCQIFGGGPVGRAGLLARNRGISIEFKGLKRYVQELKLKFSSPKLFSSKFEPAP